MNNFFDISVALIRIYKDWEPPKSNVVDFEQYSIQWASIVCAVASTPLLFLKSIEKLLKFFKYTIYSIIAFGLFILASLVRQVVAGTISFGEYKLSLIHI